MNTNAWISATNNSNSINGSGNIRPVKLTTVATKTSPAKMFAKSRNAKENGLTNNSKVSTRVITMSFIPQPLKKNLKIRRKKKIV